MAKVMRGPGGEVITGSLEVLSGEAIFSGEMTKEQMESGDLPYGGETVIFWDDQRTSRRVNPETGKEEDVFLAEGGEEFLASQLVEVEVP